MTRLLRLAALGAGLALAALAAPRLYTAVRYQPLIRTLSDAPVEPVAIVFGAGLQRSGRPAAVLYDRIASAVELYHAGRVSQLLMSGDGLTPGRNEPEAMKRTAVELGVPAEAVWTDYEGIDTYASCQRARDAFAVQRALLVTQSFHLPRALFTCDALGIAATGVSADRRAYRQSSLTFWNLREVFATANAWWELYVARTLSDTESQIVGPAGR